MYFYNVDITNIEYLAIPTMTTASVRLKKILDKHNINPVYLVEDLTNPDTKKIVYRSLKSYSGIYIVVNLVTGKYYVGSAIVGNLYMRFHKHLFSLQGSKLVANAVTKYCLCEFAFLVLEVIPEESKADHVLLLNILI